MAYRVQELLALLQPQHARAAQQARAAHAHQQGRCRARRGRRQGGGCGVEYEFHGYRGHSDHFRADTQARARAC